MPQKVFKVNNLPAVRRLPIYWHLLNSLLEKGLTSVSTTVIADTLKLDAIQVRKDLAITGIAGKPRVGYTIPALIKAIEVFLGWDNDNEAFLVGVGHLGTALLGYNGFERLGLRIVSAFDASPEKCGCNVHGVEVLPIEKMAALAKRMHVKLAILTVPAEAAQSVADQLVDAGITGIWNFTATSLEMPEGTVVQHEDLASGLAVLCHKMSQLKLQSALESPEMNSIPEEGVIDA